MDRCAEVSAACPVSATTYGYYPNLGGNALFCALFGLLALIQIVLGIKYKTWTWMIALVVGCGMECAGYAGRLLMNRNPWSDSGFKLQIVCLVLAPSLMSASVDLTLKHIVLVFGPQLSKLKPALYTWIFIGLDFFAIVMQAIGGALAASADNGNYKLLDTGNTVILIGIILQVVQLVLFGITVSWYLRSVAVYSRTHDLPARAQAYLADWKFRGFAVAVFVAFFAILIRCIYRIPEMSGGWGNGLQREETTFLILDGAMVCLSALVLTIFHPGYCFNQLARKIRKGHQMDLEKEAYEPAQTP